MQSEGRLSEGWKQFQGNFSTTKRLVCHLRKSCSLAITDLRHNELLPHRWFFFSIFCSTSWYLIWCKRKGDCLNPFGYGLRPFFKTISPTFLNLLTGTSHALLITMLSRWPNLFLEGRPMAECLPESCLTPSAGSGPSHHPEVWWEVAEAAGWHGTSVWETGLSAGSQGALACACQFPAALTSSPEVDAFGFSWELHTLLIRLCLLSTSRLLLAVYI